MARTARFTLDPAFQVGEVNPRLFGSFVEHMGRGVYGGIYDPQHPAADDEGFRTDVIELVRELGMTVFRYPGGNFVSGFKWEDGIGPRDQRPRRLNLPWHSTETNAFGLHEFVSWTDKVDGEVMLAANLGTRGILEALDLLEYANVPGGTAWSDRRRENGSERPFDIRMWCLGNELDGPWQLGAMTALERRMLAHLPCMLLGPLLERQLQRRLECGFELLDARHRCLEEIDDSLFGVFRVRCP